MRRETGNDPARPGHAGEVSAAFLTLRLTAFGGPAAHLGYFRAAFLALAVWPWPPWIVVAAGALVGTVLGR